MFVKSSTVGLALATLAATLSACSQSSTAISNLPNAAAPSAARSPHDTSIAPQARQMLALIHGRNHAVIPAPAGVAALFAPVRPAANAALYDSIVVNSQGKPYSDIASLGFECCSVDEFGDALSLKKASARVTKVSVLLSSWGCEAGSGFNGTCQTTPGSGFSEPVTLTIYGVTLDSNSKPQPGAVLLQQTGTFQIPYRPSSNPKCANTGYGGGFIGRFDRACDNGLSHVITFNVRSGRVTLPQQVIVTVAYNTSDSGYNPYGQNTQCFTSSGGCGYDSLNVSAYGDGGFIGTPIDFNGVQVYFTDAGFYCNGQPENPNYTLQDDYSCWTGYHPQIEVYGTGGGLN
jgi:hypothetical protein